MSTFKRLFNIGKGKAKVASRQAGEALAGALRPADVQPVERVDAAPPSPPAASKPPTPVSPASTAAETPKPSEPRKRRL